MDTSTSKDVQDLLADERKRKYETTHLEQRNSRLPCKVSPVHDLVKQSKENSLKLLSLKREQKRKEDIEKGKNFYTKMLFLFEVIANRNFRLLFCRKF